MRAKNPKRVGLFGSNLYVKNGLGEQEIHQQGHGVHDGGDEGACHNRRVQLQSLGAQRQQAATIFAMTTVTARARHTTASTCQVMA